MPHLILEYTDNLAPFDAHETLLALNRTLVEVAGYDEASIKARAYMITKYQVGTHDQPRGYASIRLSTRTSDPVKKREISQGLLETLMAYIPPYEGVETQYTVDILPIDPECYAKAVKTA